MFYALTPGRRTVQVLGDLAVAAWCAAWVWIARSVHGVVLQLAQPARQMQQAASDFHGAMSDAGGAVGQVPFAGDELRRQFDRVAGVADQAGAAGAQFETTVGQVSLLLGLVTALAPILGLAVPYLIRRVRFAQRAGAARAFVDSEADLDLFAWRAISHQPLPRLAGISSDPVGALRAGDRDVVHALAALELRSVGLSPGRVLVEARRGERRG